MSRCGNCGAKLGCSCKKRTASDGKSCCANCLSNYERQLKQRKKSSLSVQDEQLDITPVLLSVTAVQKN